MGEGEGEKKKRTRKRKKDQIIGIRSAFASGQVGLQMAGKCTVRPD